MTNDKPSITLELHHGSIIDLDIECIVNSAHRNLNGPGGVSGVILRAGGLSMHRQLDKMVTPRSTGDVVVTRRGDNDEWGIKAKYVLHAVANPQWDALDLAMTYANTLSMADKMGIKRIAFPLIGMGIFRYPDEAYEVMLSVLSTFGAFSTSIEHIVICDVDKEKLIEVAFYGITMAGTFM